MRLACTLLSIAIALVPLAACSGGSGSDSTPTTVSRVSATPAELTATPEQPGTPANATPTPDTGGAIHAAITPRAASDLGRTDCPSGWVAVEAAHLSVCYPDNHYAELLSTPSSDPPFLVIHLVPGDPVAETPFTLALQTVAAYDPPTVCRFEAEQPDTSAQTKIAPYTVAGSQGMACTAGTAYAVQFYGSVPTQPQPLDFRAYATVGDQLDLAKQILATVQVR